MNTRSMRLIYSLIGLAVLAVVLFLAYTWINGGSGQISATISAPTLALATATSAPTRTATEAATQAATMEKTSAATMEATPEAPVNGTGLGTVLYRIDSAQSEVSFTLTEDLRGEHTVVVGKSNQVAGDIAIDFANPAKSQLGEIRINARDLKTNNEFRNRAIRSNILQSSEDQFEFATFKPTTLEGLPASAKVGDTITFKIIGDLTVRDITQSVTFDATVKIDSDAQVSGTATAKVTRAQFKLEIPSVPNVANVSDEVTLDIKFVAPKVN